MGKTKAFGPSNDDIPKIDMQLAMLVQNAKANKLKWTAGALYRGRNGRALIEAERAKAVSCCALGAAYLAPDTKEFSISTTANDYPTNTLNELSDSYALGLGYRLAMK